MVTLTLLWVLAMVLWAHARDLRQESLPTLQDLDKDMDRILEDDRHFQEYYQCLVDLGPCNSDTKNLRAVVEEALSRQCARCSTTQRQHAVQLLRLVMECRPREYAEIERHFDPSGAFQSEYKASRSRL